MTREEAVNIKDEILRKEGSVRICNTITIDGVILIKDVLDIIDKYADDKGTAYWKYNPDTDLAECSKCGTHCPHDEIGRIETHYCPGCGAKMEGTS